MRFTRKKWYFLLDQLPFFLRRVSPAIPAIPVTTPRRADVTDPDSPVFGSTTDWLCFCDPLADSDADNDSEWEIDWLIELEYEPLPDVDPDCDWLTETEVLTDVEVDSGA